VSQKLNKLEQENQFLAFTIVPVYSLATVSQWYQNVACTFTMSLPRTKYKLRRTTIQGTGIKNTLNRSDFSPIVSHLI